MSAGKMIIVVGSAVLLADIYAQFLKAFTSDASFGFGLVASVLVFGGAVLSTLHD